MAPSKVKYTLIFLAILATLAVGALGLWAKVTFDNSTLPAKLKENSWSYFFFTGDEQNALQAHYNTSATTAIALTLAIPNLSEKEYKAFFATPRTFYYGFLDANDFLNAGTARKAQYTRSNFVTKKDIESGSLKKVLAGTDLRHFVKPLSQKSAKDSERYTQVKVSFALQKDLNEYKTPRGFFIYTEGAIKVLCANFEKAEVGFDIEQSPLFFGVPSTGGPFADVNNIDFTGASEVFSLTNTDESLMPKLDLAFYPLPDYTSRRLSLNIGGKLYKLFPSDKKLSLTVQTSLLKSPFSRYEVKSEGVRLTKLLLCDNDIATPFEGATAKDFSNPPPAADQNSTLPKSNAPFKTSDNSAPLFPIPCDTGLIVQSTAEHWRDGDYELYCWDRFPNILIFDTRNYAVQRDFFRRLAFFAEKKGYKGRVLSDSQLGDKHGYNAHDYSAQSVALFFTKAASTQVKLNEKELLLRSICLANGLITKGAGGSYSAGAGALISISQQSPDWLRNSLSNHELWHGLYFTDEDFRAQTALIFDALGEREHNFVIGYFNSQETLGYDSSDVLLMQNEFMAYIMQQSVSATPAYFLHLANRGSVIEAIPKLCSYVRNGEGTMFLPPAKKFDDYARKKWGLSCGRAWIMY